MNRLVEGLAPVATFIIGTAFGIMYHEDIVALWPTDSTRAEAPAVGTPTPIQQTEAVMSQATPLSGTRLIAPQLGDALPLVYSATFDEARIQADLHHGAVVLPLGGSFGEPGNMVVTAHSSGLGAFGPYSQAFAKLGQFHTGDQFTVVTDDGQYTYRVYGRDIVWPHEVDKLPQSGESTVTLVTCWPLWTDWQRLLVHAVLVEE